MINLFQPEVGDAELTAIRETFVSKWLGRGERVARFERTFGDYIGKPGEDLHAVTSCTEGLFHVISALGIGPGDDVVLPTVSFIGAAHAVRASGAGVVLCDVHPRTLNPTLAQVERVVTPATKAVLILHFGGSPGAAAMIAAWAADRSLTLIEDAAIGLGTFVDGQACGTLGDVGVWSFDAMKVLTTGDGGMVWCRDPDVIERIRRSTSLGLGPSGFRQRHESARWWEIDPTSPGRRGAMHSLAAAIGLVQIEKLDRSLGRRREIAAIYDAALRDLPWLGLQDPPKASVARTFYWIQCGVEARDRLAAHLLEKGIYTSFKYWPLHRTKMYGGEAGLPGADQAAASTLLLPLHAGLSDEDAQQVVAAIEEFEP